MPSWCGDGDPRGRRYPDGARVVIAVDAASAEEARILADDMRRAGPDGPEAGGAVRR